LIRHSGFVIRHSNQANWEMRIGITFDLKGNQALPAGAPDDLLEEFDSPTTIEEIASVLRSLGHEAVKLGDGRQLLERLLSDPPDFVFNFAEGEGIGRSREARVPAVLEMLGIPYSGSDPLTLALTLDKELAKRVVASYGNRVPNGTVICPDGATVEAISVHWSRFPAIVKPCWEGSSKGIRGKSVVDNVSELGAAVREMCQAYRQPILVEEFIDGDELTVGIVGNTSPQIIGIMRVLPVAPTERFIYSLDVKRDFERQVRYDCPADLSPADTEAVQRAAKTAYRVLGCRDVARVDFRLRDGVPYFLEVNPLPGLNSHSGDLVIMSRLCGWTYPQLIETILQYALERHQAPRTATAR
jgi:D-alanine-D-alanine ligase